MNITTPTAQTVLLDDDDLVTRKYAAKKLAVSIRTLDRMVERGLLKKVYVMGSPRLHHSKVQKIVAEGI